MFPASVTARLAGRASGAIRSISRCTSVCRAAPITGHTTSNLRPAFARSTGPGSIARSRVAAWTADLTDHANGAAASQYIYVVLYGSSVGVATGIPELG